MKILLLGANGQLGQTFRSHGGLAARGDLVLASRNGTLSGGGMGLVADLSEVDSLAALLHRERPGIIVNAAAYTAVDRAEQEETLATRINGEAVAAIGDWAAHHDALVLHYSTDYVFPGDATMPYKEDSHVAPAGAYGRSKLAGEIALRYSGAAHFILRTAWVYSPFGNNFLRTMLRLGADRDEVRVVSDQTGTPTDTTLIVDASLATIDRWIAADATGRATLEGTYHLTATGSTTWHGFAEAALRRGAELGLLARMPAVIPIPTSEFPTPAKRPAYSVLDTGRFARAFSYAIPGWDVGVDRTLATLSNHPE